MSHFVHVAVPAEAGGGVLTVYSENVLTAKDAKDRGLAQPTNKRARRISIDVNPKDFGVSMDMLPPHALLQDAAKLADDSTVHIVRLSSQEIEVAGLQTTFGTYLCCTKNGGPVGTTPTLSSLTMWSVAAGKTKSLLLRDVDGLYLASDSQGKVFTAPLQLMAWGQAHWTVEESRYLKSAYDKYFVVVSDGSAYCSETCEPASALTRAGTIMFEGWLKLKSNRKITLYKYHERYFVVSNGKLSYYHNQARYSEGILDKQFSIQDIVTVDSDKDDPCCFTVTFTAHIGVVLTLIAHSVEIADSWISVLRDERDAHSSLASFFQTQRMLKFERKSSQRGGLPMMRMGPDMTLKEPKRGSYSGSFDLSAPGTLPLDSPLVLFPELCGESVRDLPDDIVGLRIRAQEASRHNQNLRAQLSSIDHLLVEHKTAVTRLDACLSMVQCFPTAEVPRGQATAARSELLELTSDLAFLEQRHARLAAEARALRAKAWELRHINQGESGVVSLNGSDEEGDIVLVHL